MRALRALWAGMLFVLGGCLPRVETPPPVHLRLVGSSSMAPLVSTLAEEYQRRFSHVTFEIRPEGSQRGLDAVRGGEADVALVSRALEAEELGEFRATTVAWDGIALAVAPDNPLSSLTLTQLRQIFSGEIVDWRALGGPPGPLQVVSREEGSGTRRAFEALVFTEGGRLTSTAVIAPSSQAVAAYLVESPSALAYLSMALLPREAKALAIEGIVPNPQTVAARRYPLFRPLLLVRPQDAPRAVEDFIAYALSPAAQRLIGRQYARAR